jgi:hypothetical protein
MPFHFSDAEYAARLSKAAAAIQARDLEGGAAFRARKSLLDLRL